MKLEKEMYVSSWPPYTTSESNFEKLTRIRTGKGVDYNKL